MTYSDKISLLALVISILSFLSTIFLVIVTKRIEVKFSKFQKFCLDIVEETLGEIQKLFDDDIRNTDRVSVHRQKITDKYVDLALYLIELQKIYTRIDVNQIQDLCIEFSDKLYENPNQQLVEFKNDFLINKLLITEKLYEYALYEELNIFSKKVFFR